MVANVVRKVFYQKCHDKADCGRCFGSNEFPTPDELVATLALVPGGGRGGEEEEKEEEEEEEEEP